VASSLDIQQVLDAVTGQLINHLGVDGCTLSEWDQAADVVSTIAETSSQYWFDQQASVRDYDLVEYPLTKQVLVEQKAVQMTISQPDIDPAELALMQEIEIKTLLMLPMIYQGEALGLVELSDSRDERTFTEQQISLAQLLANQAASAIQHARLYQQAQHEISVRKQAQEQLRFQAQLLDSTADSIVATDLDGQVTYWGKGAEALYGYTADEVVGRPITFIVAPQEKEEEERMRQVRETGLWSGQYVQKRRDGSSFWAATVISLATDEAGQPFGLIGIARDITERVQMEEALRTSQQLLQSALDALAANIAVLDDTGMIIMVNASWRTFGDENGLAWEDYGVGRNYLAVIDSTSSTLAEEAQAAAQGIGELLSGQRELVSLEYPCHSPSEERWFIMRATRFRSSESMRVAVSHENITDRVRAEKQLAQAAASAERTRLARELHDSVTQSLYSITLHIDATLLALSSSKYQVVEQHLRRLNQMARDAMTEMRLLIFEMRPPILEEVGLAAALKARLEAVESRSGIGVDLQVEGNRPLPPTIEAELFWVALEGLNNVVKHAQASQVTVRLVLNEDRARMTIQDDGIGFDLETATRYGGYGLATMKERVQQINGTMSIDTTPSAGTILEIEVFL
jgi:PAS domain S-box-containing protein